MAAPGGGYRRLKEPTACPPNGCHCMIHVQPIDSGFSAELVSTPMAATNPAPRRAVPARKEREASRIFFQAFFRPEREAVP